MRFMHIIGFMRPGLIWLVLVWLILSGCANIVAPGGGPRDLAPPLVLDIQPPDKQTMFRAREVVVTFDEFIEVKDLNNELFVSPPMSRLPETRLKGKRLLIQIPDSLADSTTYTLSFGKAIRDITEANILEDFSYTFSTGPVRDSLMIKGQVVDAYTLEGQGGVLVSLYKDLSDTAFTGRPPDHIARTNAQGDFVLRNLGLHDFRLYALKDMNSNFYYDQPNESIAFLSQTIRPEHLPPAVSDTQQPDQDTLTVLGDSTLQSVRLHMFTDRDTSQTFLKAWLVKQGHVSVTYRNPIDSLLVAPLLESGDEPIYLITYSALRDTIHLWLNAAGQDSLFAIAELPGIRKDTLQVSLRPRPTGRGPRKEGDEKEGFSVVSVTRPMADPGLSMVLASPYPVSRIIAERFIWIHGEDTLQPTVIMHEGQPLQVLVGEPLLPGEKYSLTLLDSALYDMRDLASKGVTFSYTVAGEDDYGQLSLTFSNMPASPWFIELLDGEGRVIRRLEHDNRDVLNIAMLRPGKYTFRAVLDHNHNGRWDPGFFKVGVQPEEVIYFPQPVDVRAKWERAEKWDLKPLTE